MSVKAKEELNQYVIREPGILSGAQNIYAWRFEALAKYSFFELERLKQRLEKDHQVHIGIGLNTLQDIIKRVVYLDGENKILKAKLKAIEEKL